MSETGRPTIIVCDGIDYTLQEWHRVQPHPDSVRMDWLEKHLVEAHLFKTVDDYEDMQTWAGSPFGLKAKIDAEMGKEKDNG